MTYMEAWLDPAGPKHQFLIADKCGIPRRTVSGWVATRAFKEWFNESIARHTEHLWQPVLLKLTSVALQGSVEHMKLLAQVRGAIRPPDSPGANVTVVVGIPRPGDEVQLPREADRPSLPPPITVEHH